MKNFALRAPLPLLLALAFLPLVIGTPPVRVNTDGGSYIVDTEVEADEDGGSACVTVEGDGVDASKCIVVCFNVLFDEENGRVCAPLKIE